MKKVTREKEVSFPQAKSLRGFGLPPLLEDIVSSSKTAIIGKLLNDTIFFWSAGAEKMYGWEESEIIGHSILELVPKEYQRDLVDLFGRVKKGEDVAPLETKRLRKDGELFDVLLEISPLKNKRGEIIGCVTLTTDITAKKEIERELNRTREALEASERRLGVVLGSGGVGVWEVSLPSREFFATKELALLFDLVKENPTADDFQKLIHQEDLPLVYKTIEAAIEKKHPFQFEFRIATTRGRLKWVECRGHVFFTPEGEPRRITGVCFDITERRLSEELLRNNESILRTTFEGITDSIFVKDLFGRFVLANSECVTRASAFAGVDNLQIIGKTEIDFLPKKLAERILATEQEVLSTGNTITVEEHVAVGNSSKVFLSTKTPYRNEKGEIIGLIGISRDITERKKEEQRFAFLARASEVLSFSLDSETRLQSLAELIVGHVADWCVIDARGDDGVIRRVAIAHKNREKVDYAQSIWKRYPLDPEATNGVPKVIRTGEPELYEVIPGEVLRRGNVRRRYTQLIGELGMHSAMIVPLKVGERVLGAISFVLSETGRHYTKDDLHFALDIARRSAIALDNAELYKKVVMANRAKSQFVTTLGHELRNPLTPILSNVDLMLRLETNPELSESLRKVERQVKIMSRLLDDLLDVSRMTQGKIILRKEVMNVQRAIEETAKSAEYIMQRHNHRFTLDLPKRNLFVNVDPTRFDQILINLLHNAAKYTQPGGEIDLRLSGEKGNAVIRVRDNGIGITRDMLPRIFDLFMQANQHSRVQGGLGVGLTMVKSLTEMHGGTISVESDGLGRGSTFIVRLPLVSGRSIKAREVPTPTPTAEKTSRRVLVVDDNADIASTFKQIIRTMGHEVTCALEGKEAIQTALEFKPDIVLLDLGLPDMNGYEVLESLKNEEVLRDTRFVAITGYGQKKDIEHAKDAGFHDHLTKPVGLEALEKILS